MLLKTRLEKHSSFRLLLFVRVRAETLLVLLLLGSGVVSLCLGNVDRGDHNPAGMRTTPEADERSFLIVFLYQRGRRRAWKGLEIFA